MAGLDGDEARAALGDAYQGVTGMLDGLAESDFLLPTHCLGWTVSDVLYHLLGDARRALAALATPAGTPPRRGLHLLLEAWKPRGDDALARAWSTRAVAAAVTALTGPAALTEAWQETAPAAVRVAALAPYPVVAT